MVAAKSCKNAPLYHPLTGRIIKWNGPAHKKLVATVSAVPASAWWNSVAAAHPNITRARVDQVANWWLAHVGKKTYTAASSPAAVAGNPKATVVHVTTSAEFARLINSAAGMPVVVDFFATWCGPCKALGPAIPVLAKEYAGKALFAKVDVDKGQHLADKYKVSALPTVHIFQQGRKVWSGVGVNETRLRAAVRKFV